MNPMMENASSTVKASNVPTDLGWLSSRQADHAQQPNGDILLRTCAQLEAQVVWQSDEIETLRQMLQSEHDRHARGSLTLATRTESRLRSAWVRLVKRALWARRRALSAQQTQNPMSLK
jgi:hypothetical protein